MAATAARTSAASRGQAFGLEVRAAFAVPGLGGGIRRSPSRRVIWRKVESAQLEREWSRREVEPLVDLRHPDGRAFMTIGRDPVDGYRIWAPRHGRHIVSLDGRRISSALPQRAPLAWQRLCFAQTLPLAAALQSLEVLHASAVALGDSVIAFTASSGNGKSSLAAHLTAGGATFVTDDVLALERDGTDVLAHPGPGRASVPAAETAAMTAAGRRRLGRRLGAGGRLHFAVPAASGPLPLRILYRIRRSPRLDRLQLRELSRPEPRFVLENSFLTYLQTRERLLNQLDVCAAVVSSACQVELEIPAGTSARTAADAVLTHARGTLDV